MVVFLSPAGATAVEHHFYALAQARARLFSRQLALHGQCLIDIAHQPLDVGRCVPGNAQVGFFYQRTRGTRRLSEGTPAPSDPAGS